MIACDEKAVPLETWIARADDDYERQELLLGERRPLYVACTRAREHLFVSGVAPASPFLELHADG